jgi:hypothetical protein
MPNRIAFPGRPPPAKALDSLVAWAIEKVQWHAGGALAVLKGRAAIASSYSTAAVAAKPSEKITLRQGARVMMKNWTE